LLDEHGNLKISDFGLSSLYIGDSDGETNRTQLLHTTCGTPNYVAPEVLSDQGYDGKKADVWSIGVILYVLVAGFLPFDESTIVALFAKIQNADFTYPSWFDELIRSLLDQMLVADPKARLTLSDLKQHPWCTNGNVASLGDLSTKGSKEKVDGKRDSYDLDAAFQNHHIEDEDNDDQQQHDVTVLNAFDLVSQCGGFLLNKMFSPEYFYAAINTATARPDSARAKGAELVSSPSGKVLFGSSRFTQKSKCFHFSSSSTSPQELMGAIYDSLKEMNFDFNMSRNTIVHSGSLKGNLVTQKGMVGIFVQVFIISPYLNLVEIQKGKGDILEWSNAFNELTNKKIAHLINKSQVI
jgi:serine/threonine protein kinase